MTLSNDQIIQVAVDVWKAKIIYYDSGKFHQAIIHHNKFPELNRTFSHINLLKKEVNSWPGFGRTVEAMAELLRISN